MSNHVGRIQLRHKLVLVVFGWRTGLEHITGNHHWYMALSPVFPSSLARGSAWKHGVLVNINAKELTQQRNTQVYSCCLCLVVFFSTVLPASSALEWQAHLLSVTLMKSGSEFSHLWIYKSYRTTRRTFLTSARKGKSSYWGLKENC